MKVVLASNNAGKLKEMQSILKVLDVTLAPQREFGVEDADETGSTFVENAIIKARHACVQTGLPAISDDSGLQVPALAGAPGVHSSRYSGGDAQANVEKLLENLKACKGAKRCASFYCVIVYFAHENDPTPLICQGRWDGMILEAPVGDGGFGYDPIFYVPECELGAAQLAPTEKNKISHRGKALQQLLSPLPECLKR